MDFFRSHYRRTGIFVIGVLWLILGASWIPLLDRPDRFLPEPTVALFWIAAFFMFFFAVRPDSERLFSIAGGMSVVALACRAMSAIAGQFLEDDPQAIAIAISASITSTMLFFLFWWFWQREVKPWHIFHQRLTELTK